MMWIRNQADLDAIEAVPYEQALPARSPYGLIAAAAARWPQRDALVFLPSGDVAEPAQRTTYAELLASIHRAANLFRSLGVQAGDAVAILAPNLPLTHAALWGAQLAGRACPINFLLQPEHIAALLRASGSKVLVALGPDAEIDVWSTACKVLELVDIPLVVIPASGGVPRGIDFARALQEQPQALAFDPVLHPDQVAACFHTGGTTGAPKLALHTQGNEAHTGWFAHRFYGFDEHTVEMNGFPLFHVAGAFVYGLSVLAVGGTQVLPTRSGMRNAAFVRNYWRFCDREGVTALACVPTILATLANLPVDADISRVRIAYTGGSPLPNELAAQFEARTGLPVRNILGMTECAGLISIEPAASPRVPGSTGLRLPYTEVSVVPWRDGQAQLGEQCAIGETGVVVVRGPHVSPGYSEPARNTGMFEQGWLVSGDLGHLDTEGHLFITGRAKDVIIRGAHNIDPGLVEEALLAHPAVAMAAVVGEPDAHAGEVPVAFVTLKPGVQADAATLLAEVAPHVYERPAVPKRLTVLPALPLTAIGKVYKPALRRMAVDTRLREDLARLGVPFELDVQERPSGIAAVLRLDTSDAPQLRERLASAIGAMSLQLDASFAKDPA
jgi:fatty-acyl-CoA synthase